MFPLVRSFALLSFLCISLITMLPAWFLSHFVAAHMLRRDAVVTMEFVQRLLEATHPNATYIALFDHVHRPLSTAAFVELFQHSVPLPDIVRTSTYALDGTRIWSTNPGQVGIRNLANTKLLQALRGELAVSEEAVIWDILPAEQQRVPPGTQYFAEMYMPIRNLEHNTVVGVVEVYKASDALFQAIRRGQQLIWGGAVGGGLLLYGLLLGIIRRASRLIQQQREQILATETLVAMGEMAAVMAHNIHNPLATMRSAAEVVLEDQTAQPLQPQAEDIIAEIDKLEGWLYDLLNHTRLPDAAPTPVPLATVLQSTVDRFVTTLPAQGVDLHVDAPGDLPLIQADATLLQQVLHTVIANAADAMPQGGTLTIQAACTPNQDQVQVQVRDTGHGMSQETIAKVFQPFFTTKRQGLGIGLALARRMVERYGGTIALSSAEGAGTTVTVTLPIAA